jgi:hypothetical protein
MKKRPCSVESWKGIPYAQPPLGPLRFMPPEQLSHQSAAVVNATTNPDRCVQFTLAPYGVHNAYLGPGTPGTEDCLKLYVWKPAKARKGNKLPVVVFVHVRHPFSKFFAYDPGSYTDYRAADSFSDQVLKMTLVTGYPMTKSSLRSV